MTVITCSSRNAIVSAKNEHALRVGFLCKEVQFHAYWQITNINILKDYFSVYLGKKPLSSLILESMNYICIVTYVKTNLVWKSDTAVFYFLKQNKKKPTNYKEINPYWFWEPPIYLRKMYLLTHHLFQNYFVRKATRLTKSTRRCNFCICFYPLIFQIRSKYLSNETWKCFGKMTSE